MRANSWRNLSVPWTADSTPASTADWMSAGSAPSASASHHSMPEGSIATMSTVVLTPTESRDARASTASDTVGGTDQAPVLSTSVT